MTDSLLPPRYKIISAFPAKSEIIDFYISKGYFTDLSVAVEEGYRTYPKGFKIWALHHKLAQVVFEYGLDEALIQPEV